MLFHIFVRKRNLFSGEFKVVDRTKKTSVEAFRSVWLVNAVFPSFNERLEYHLTSDHGKRVSCVFPLYISISKILNLITYISFMQRWFHILPQVLVFLFAHEVRHGEKVIRDLNVDQQIYLDQYKNT